MNKISSIIIAVFITLGILLVTYFRFSNNDDYILFTIISSFVLSFSTKPYVEYIRSISIKYKWQEDLYSLIKKGNIKKDDYIRISYAYLYRIKINNKYLLIQNFRYEHPKYQPVGGVYKYTDEYKKLYIDDRYVITDDNVSDKTTKNDFRLKVIAGKINKFYSDFNTGVQLRENSNFILREFYEEFFEENNNIKNQRDKFGDIGVKFIGRHIEGITYSPYFSIYEMLLADIYELDFSVEQKNIILDIISSSQNFKLVSSDEIKSRGHIKGSYKFSDFITAHSYKILDETSKQLLKVEKY